LELVGRAENLAVAGPSGTGNTHFVEALAHKVIDAGMRVSWFTLESLTAAIGRATIDGSVAKTIARITRAELIAIDDIGMLPAGQAAGEAFYRVVDAAYERRSLAVTSNLHPHAQDAGHRHRRPAAAPCPRRPHRGHITTPLRGPRRTRSGALDLSSHREISCPRIGRSSVRQQGDQLTARREVPLSVDRRADAVRGQHEVHVARQRTLGRNRWCRAVASTYTPVSELFRYLGQCRRVLCRPC
jgi:IstB-like ATP binding protein